MKIRQRAGRALALSLILALCLGLLPGAAGAEEVHTHVWRTDWAIDDYHHWRGCADPNCRTLVPAWAEGYDYHSYDNAKDPDCNICGWIRAVDPGHVHTWSGIWEGDGTHHWLRCSDPGCPGVVPAWAKGYGGHTYAGGAPNCAVCGRARFVPSSHTHTWGTGWNGDGGFHWRRCTGADCPGVTPNTAQDYGAHVYDGAQDPDCNICGQNRFVDPGHTHTWGTGWNGDGSCHWHICTDAGCPGVVPGWAKGYAPHVYDGDMDPDCNICGMARVVLPPSDGDWFDVEEPDAAVAITGRGWVKIRPASPKEGDKVDVILIPAEHYTAAGVSVSTLNGEAVAAARQEGGVWSFRQPGEEVKFRAEFLPSYESCAKDGSCPLSAFSDLAPEQWYHDGIHYCLDWELMHGCGQSVFVPDAGLSGGMMAQILYNMAGRPEVPGGGAYQGAGLWYDGAAAWAVGAGVMDFGGPCNLEEQATREQLAVMLWRCAGRPAASGPALAFNDSEAASVWAEEAVEWAVGRGILHGRGDGSLDPGGLLTRAEAAAALVRFHQEAQLIWDS